MQRLSPSPLGGPAHFTSHSTPHCGHTGRRHFHTQLVRRPTHTPNGAAPPLRPRHRRSVSPTDPRHDVPGHWAGAGAAGQTASPGGDWASSAVGRRSRVTAFTASIGSRSGSLRMLVVLESSQSAVVARRRNWTRPQLCSCQASTVRHSSSTLDVLTVVL